MKKYFLFAFVAILSLSCIAQTKYENGYFINNAGLKTNCLIKNLDWRINPKEINYKLSETSPQQKATIENIKEFEITGRSKYIRYNTEIEKFVDIIERLNTSKEPIFKPETLFLKVLIEGKISLFVYTEEKNTFFIKNDNSEVAQLIYKKYLTENRLIAENFDFRKQLFDALKCNKLTTNDFRNLSYDITSLTALFKTFNSCLNYDYTDFNKKPKKDLFNLNIKSGLNYSSLTVSNDQDIKDYVDFGNKATLKLGLEGEFVLNFGNDKWAIPMSVDYQYFNATASTKFDQIVDAKINALNLSIGLRYYLYLNQNSKIFLNGILNYGKYFDSEIKYKSSYKPLELTATPNLIFGLGYKQNNRYSAELRYDSSKDILTSYKVRSASYRNISLAFGYTLF